MNNLKDFFKDWVGTIKIPERNKISSSSDEYKKFKSIIYQEDLFFNFNYTKTIEKLYSMDNVYHIHGTSENPIVGHGNNKPETGNDDYFQLGHIRDLKDLLRKDTKKIIYENGYYFYELSNATITGLYFYGFSFGEVDQPYIERIISALSLDELNAYFKRYPGCNNDSLFKKLESYNTGGTKLIFNEY